ncbi:MAG: FAD-dependent oxidoreductase [Patescibacteria group bacterium]
MRHVIIGGGIAGVTAAEELRKLDPDAEITIVSEEHHPLYSRVLLPHYLKGKIPRERVFLKKETWYAEKNTEWMTGVMATSLNAKNKFVTLSNGRELEYDKLLIATGGELRTIEADLRGVSYLRTLDDADHLLQLLGERTGTSPAAVYGGGFIACEYINFFAHHQVPTRVGLRGSYFWSRVLEHEAGALIQKQLDTHGVQIMPNVNLLDMIDEKEIKHSCSILGVGIGIQPDFSWMREAGLEVESGIKCDAFLKTNLPDVYAAGDVAEFYDVIVGRHVHVGNWMNAQMQGRHVAKSMMGQEVPFALVSSYATNILGLEIIFIGDVSKQEADEVKLFGSAEEGGVAQLFGRKGQLVGAVLIGRNQDRAIITKMIQARDLLVNFSK